MIESAREHCLLLRVGVVATAPRCLSVMRMLHGIKPHRLRLKLVALAPTSKSIACSKFAGEMDILVCDHYKELLHLDGLDVILELTGDPQVSADLMLQKPASLGVLDRQASLLFFDVANLFQPMAERESEISLATCFASAMLEASPDGVMVVDKDFRIIRCNRSILVRGGHQRAGALEDTCYSAVHGSLMPCAECGRVCPMEETLRTGKPARAMHEIKTPSGEAKVCHVTTYPLFNGLGEIVQVVEVIRDLTLDLKMRVEERAQAIKDDLTRFVQDDRLASLGRLVASVCHEINNPISSIVTFNKLILSYIKDKELPPQGLASFERYLELSVREALRCGGIVKNLLTFARQKSIQARQIDLLEMTKTLMMLIKHQLEQSRVQCEILLPEPPFTTWGDFAQIQQCLMNLLFNAIEAMPNGGKLTIAGGKDGDEQVWMTVADTGIGISAQDLPRIFEPFYSTKEDGRGVGLGLSMVYGIIREHNGTIEVKSQPGQGSEFKMKLPVGPSGKSLGEKGAAQ